MRHVSCVKWHVHLATAKWQIGICARCERMCPPLAHYISALELDRMSWVCSEDTCTTQCWISDCNITWVFIACCWMINDTWVTEQDAECVALWQSWCSLLYDSHVHSLRLWCYWFGTVNGKGVRSYLWKWCLHAASIDAFVAGGYIFRGFTSYAVSCEEANRPCFLVMICLRVRLCVGSAADGSVWDV
jgi:hypothetical protein